MKKTYLVFILFIFVFAVARAQQEALANDTTQYTLNEVVYSARSEGNYISKMKPAKVEVISNAGLCKMACCNLAESFENTASVSVGYSDAVSGSRQIRLLGLSGKYTSMLEENRPAMRGLSAPFGLSFLPGQWLESIQIAKGPGSVINGYESIAGQINMELRKPSTEEPLFVNAYIDNFLRTELNIVSSLQLNQKWSTAIFAHGSIDAQKHDGNNDGFMDEPLKKQLNFGNRWLYMADNGIQWRFGVNGLYERRDGGQMNFDKDAPRNYAPDSPYGTKIDNSHFNAYTKLGIPLNEDNSTNIAFVADYTYHKINTFFGVKDYDGTQQSAFVNLLLQNTLNEQHKFTAGISGHFDDYNELLSDRWFDAGMTMHSNIRDLGRREITGGIFGEYTFNYEDKLTLIAGLRADYNNLYNWLVTPRANLKYNITDQIVLRASAGRGFRSANVVTDNIGMLATGRQIRIDDALQMEDAWTYGGSLMFYFKLFQDEKAYISLDYFRTDFNNQVLVDQERDYNSVWIYNLPGKSYTNAYQIDFNAEPVERFTVALTFRYNDTRADYAMQGLLESPLIDRYKGVLNLQYATPMNKWIFDVTGQVNGQSRLPNFVYDDHKDHYSPVYPMFFAQVTRRFKGLDVYLGVENILNYTQDNPIINAENPYATGFNSSVIWGPLMGRKFYAGIRYTLFK